MRFLSLLRASLTEGMSLFRVKKGSSKASAILAGVMFVAMLGYAAGLAVAIKEQGGEMAVVLMLFCFATALLTLLEGIYKSGDLLFKCRDEDLLLSLPLTRSAVVFLRLLKFYLFELAFNSLFLLPAIIVYSLNALPSGGFYAAVLVVLVCAPVIPIAVASVAGVVSVALSTRFKKNNLVQTLLMFAVMIIVTGVSVVMNGNFLDNIGAMAGGASEKLVRIYPPAGLLAKLAGESDFGLYVRELGGFILLNLAVGGAVILGISKVYFRVSSRARSSRSGRSIGVSEEEVLMTRKMRTPGRALVLKELNRFFNTPVFIVNSGFGLILYLLAIFAVSLKFEGIVRHLTGQGAEVVELVSGYLPAGVMGLLIFTSLMTIMTAVMIPLEGKAINLLKTLPVGAKEVMMAKVRASMLIILPMLGVGTIVAILRFRFGILESLMLIFATVLLPLLTELTGVLIGLKHARFDAENDTEVVKQSAGVTIAVFLGMGGAMVLIGILAGLVYGIGQKAGMMMFDAVIAGTVLLVYLRVAKVAEERFKRLQV